MLRESPLLLRVIRYRSLRDENRSMSAMLRKRRVAVKASSVAMGRNREVVADHQGGGHQGRVTGQIAMGINIFDNLDFERAVQARRLDRFEFPFTAAPLRIEKRNRIAAQSI